MRPFRSRGRSAALLCAACSCVICRSTTSRSRSRLRSISFSLAKVASSAASSRLCTVASLLSSSRCLFNSSFCCASFASSAARLACILGGFGRLARHAAPVELFGGAVLVFRRHPVAAADDLARLVLPADDLAAPPLDWAIAVPAIKAASVMESAAAENARKFSSMGCNSILFAVAPDRGEILRVPRVGLQVPHQVVERGDADHRNIIAFPHFLDRGQLPAAALHAVERDRHPAGYSARRPGSG